MVLGSYCGLISTFAALDWDLDRVDPSEESFFVSLGCSLSSFHLCVLAIVLLLRHSIVVFCLLIFCLPLPFFFSFLLRFLHHCLRRHCSQVLGCLCCLHFLLLLVKATIFFSLHFFFCLHFSQDAFSVLGRFVRLLSFALAPFLPGGSFLCRSRNSFSVDCSLLL